MYPFDSERAHRARRSLRAGIVVITLGTVVAAQGYEEGYRDARGRGNRYPRRR